MSLLPEPHEIERGRPTWEWMEFFSKQARDYRQGFVAVEQRLRELMAATRAYLDDDCLKNRNLLESLWNTIDAGGLQPLTKVVKQ